MREVFFAVLLDVPTQEKPPYHNKRLGIGFNSRDTLRHL